MEWTELIVSVRHEKQELHGLNASADEPQQIDRRLVRPVRILSDDDGRLITRTKRCEDRVEENVAARHVLGHLEDIEPQRRCDVHQRSERTRRRERVARRLQSTRGVTGPSYELVDQGGFSNPSLAADEHDASTTFDGFTKVTFKYGELSIAFKQYHVCPDPRSERSIRTPEYR